MRPALLPLVLLLACAGPGDDGDPVSPGTPGALVAEAGEAAFVHVGEPLTLSAEGSRGAVSAQWTFGDGARSERLDALTVEHTYEQPGHYVVTVQVWSADGRAQTDSVTVTVTWPALEVPPTHSGTVALVGDVAYVAMPDLDRVARVDVVRREVIGWLTPCGAPTRLTVRELERGPVLAVACRERSPGVAIYDLTGEEPSLTGQLDLTGAGVSPFGVVIDPKGVVWVSAAAREDDAGHLLTVSLTGEPLGDLPLGHDLRELAWADGQLLALRHRSPPEHGELWRVREGESPDRIEVVRHPGPDSDTSARGVPTQLHGLAVRPDGRTLVVAGVRANVERGVVRDGLPLTFESTVRADLRHLVLDPREGGVGDELDRPRFDNRDLVSAAAWHPRGDWLYVVFGGMRAVESTDGFTMRTSGSRLGLGHGMDGLAVSPGGDMLYVHARYDRELILLPIDGPEVGEVAGRVSLTPPGEEPWAEDVLSGARLFHDASDRRMGRDGYTSCGSCHLHGEHDGVTWDFTSRGEGLRDTIGLRGMSERVGGPIHWSGNFDEVQDFEGDIRGPQGGTGYLDDAHWSGGAGASLGAPKAGLSAELDALAAYVESLEPVDVPWSPDPERLEAGRALFASEEVGCAGCHPAGRTDSSWTTDREPLLHDVGTLRPTSGSRLGGALTGLDTPSLVGAWRTAPYLHDGRAATLREVLTVHNPEDAHGRTSHLTAQELDDLELYLRSL